MGSEMCIRDSPDESVLTRNPAGRGSIRTFRQVPMEFAMSLETVAEPRFLALQQVCIEMCFVDSASVLPLQLSVQCTHMFLATKGCDYKAPTVTSSARILSFLVQVHSISNCLLSARPATLCRRLCFPHYGRCFLYLIQLHECDAKWARASFGRKHRTAAVQKCPTLCV